MAYTNMSNINEFFGIMGQGFVDSMGSVVIAGAVWTLVFIFILYKNRGGFLGLLTLGTSMINLLSRNGYLPEFLTPLLIIIGGAMFGNALIRVTRS